MTGFCIVNEHSANADTLMYNEHGKLFSDWKFNRLVFHLLPRRNNKRQRDQMQCSFDLKSDVIYVLIWVCVCVCVFEEMSLKDAIKCNSSYDSYGNNFKPTQILGR